MTPQPLLLIQCCLSIVHVNEVVGVGSYRLPRDLARVMNVITWPYCTFVRFSNTIILTVFSTVIRGGFGSKLQALHQNIVFKWRSLYVMCE